MGISRPSKMRVRRATSPRIGSKQLWTRFRDVAAYDQDFRIENVQNADHGTLQVFQGPIEHANCAFVPFSRGAKNGLCVRRVAVLSERQLRGCSPV